MVLILIHRTVRCGGGGERGPAPPARWHLLFKRKKIRSAWDWHHQGDGQGFQQVAGLDSDEIHVSKVGWSFGGQWADFDNDGLLDLYVPSGYYSAPKTVATTTDL